MSKQFEEIRKELDSCERPLFFLHDDPDGLSSFILLYRYCKKGNGILVKSNPRVDSNFLAKVYEYSPDKIFILDVAIVDQEFIDGAGVPVIWIDHHAPLKRDNVLYLNPRIAKPDDYKPTSYLCYNIAMQKEDMWIAMVGCIGDWHFPEFAGEFSRKYPDLNGAKNADEAFFSSKIGVLVNVFSFILKGKSQEALKCMKIATRISSPYEILRQETPQARYLYRRYESVNEKYQKLMKEARSAAGKGSMVLFIYRDDEISFTKDIANVMLYENQDKLVIIGREKDGEIKLSMRSRKTILPPLLEKALEGLEGYGGGHEYACGANVSKKDFPVFLERIRKGIE